MLVCDICGRDISQTEMNTVNARVIVDATDKGFVPTTLPMEGFTSAFGVTKADSWRHTVQKYSTANWGLCATCLAEVRRCRTKRNCIETSRKQKPEKLVSCPMCKAAVKPENIDRHKSKCRGQEQTRQGQNSDSVLREAAGERIKQMSEGEVRSFIDDYVQKRDLKMISLFFHTFNTMPHRERGRRADIAIDAMKRFGREGVEFVLRDFLRAPDEVAIFLLSKLVYFESYDVADLIISRLGNYSEFKRGCLVRMLKMKTGKRFFLGSTDPNKWKRWWRRNKEKFFKNRKYDQVTELKASVPLRPQWSTTKGKKKKQTDHSCVAEYCKICGQDHCKCSPCNCGGDYVSKQQENESFREVERMRKLATIQMIKNLAPIEDADRIEKAAILEWSVVVPKGQFNVGDLCVYFETDSLLPDEPRYEFLKENSWDIRYQKIRLKTIKLRGQVSQGLALPLKDFPEIKDIEEGNDVTKLLGIEKHIGATRVHTERRKEEGEGAQLTAGDDEMIPKKGCPYFKNERCEIDQGVANPSAIMFTALCSTDPGYVDRICRSEAWKQECTVYASAPMMVKGFSFRNDL